MRNWTRRMANRLILVSVLPDLSWWPIRNWHFEMAGGGVVVTVKSTPLWFMGNADSWEVPATTQPMPILSASRRLRLFNIALFEEGLARLNRPLFKRRYFGGLSSLLVQPIASDLSGSLATALTSASAHLRSSDLTRSKPSGPSITATFIIRVC